MKRLCFVLVLVLAGAAAGAIEKRIVGSKNCGKERQYHVQIKSVQGGKSCGGSLISTRWVITASHCAQQLVKVNLGLNADKSIRSKIKAFFLGPSKKNEQDIKVEQQFTYKNEEGNPHDITLLKLNEDVSAKLPVIELPPAECSKPEKDKQVRIGGWGAKKKTSTKTPGSLKCASTKIADCGENDKPDNKYHSDEATAMCAFQSGVEACFGDSGSAVEYDGKLYGIIVSDPVDKCANPIVMLDICPYKEWIEKTMRENDS